MERTAVRSTEIAVVGYDSLKKILEITFRRGGVYHYFNIPPDVYDALLKAPSLGTYFSGKIKDSYRYEKIAG